MFCGLKRPSNGDVSFCPHLSKHVFESALNSALLACITTNLSAFTTVHTHTRRLSVKSRSQPAKLRLHCPLSSTGHKTWSAHGQAQPRRCQSNSYTLCVHICTCVCCRTRTELQSRFYIFHFFHWTGTPSHSCLNWHLFYLQWRARRAKPQTTAPRWCSCQTCSTLNEVLATFKKNKDPKKSKRCLFLTLL